MNTGKTMQWISGLIAGTAALLMTAGCQQPDTSEKIHGEDFVAQDSTRQVYDFVASQSANGAHADATLHPWHFDGAELNSLGAERLELMLHNGTSYSPLVVYLDVSTGSDADKSHRETSVTAFLKDHGLTDDQIKLKNGSNPDSHSYVAPIIAGQTGAAAAAGGGNATVAK